VKHYEKRKGGRYPYPGEDNGKSRRDKTEEEKESRKVGGEPAVCKIAKVGPKKTGKNHPPWGTKPATTGVWKGFKKKKNGSDRRKTRMAGRGGERVGCVKGIAIKCGGGHWKFKKSGRKNGGLPTKRGGS